MSPESEPRDHIDDYSNVSRLGTHQKLWCPTGFNIPRYDHTRSVPAKSIAPGTFRSVRVLIGEDDAHLNSFVQRDHISKGLYAGAARQNVLSGIGIV
jgi:hypothetical protein